MDSYKERITFHNCRLSGGENAPDTSTVNHQLNVFKVINGLIIFDDTDFDNFSFGNNSFFEFDSFQSYKSYFNI